jgi:restriction endonuclease S subunit
LKRDYFEDLGSGTTFKELSRGAIEKIAISVPDLELQEQFETLFKQSDKSKYYIQMGKKRIDKEKNRCLMKMILNN